ncbi:MAG TPA: 2-dehydropantoate 2-reductase [Bacteroidia bacterium]|jgi:2-dehydropantoate 2-reductase
MSKKKRIAILGIGAVGGYIGALLAEKYRNSTDIEIIFIARERTVEIIQAKGLKLITPHNEKIVFPHLVSNDPKEIGSIDFLICCVKSYDLTESLIPLKECIHPGTVILPLLNGVDARERIAPLFPTAEIWDGCVYIISRLVEPGIVREIGNIHSFYFGSQTASETKLKQLESILKAATIDCHLSDTILQTIWEKFIFISVVASLTSYLNLPIGAILENEKYRELLHQLLSEVKAVADAKQIGLPEDIINKSIATMERMPFETTSSMHSDFLKGGKTEYRSLTEYVTEAGKKCKIPTPAYNEILKKLIALP